MQTTLKILVSLMFLWAGSVYASVTPETLGVTDYRKIISDNVVIAKRSFSEKNYFRNSKMIKGFIFYLKALDESAKEKKATNSTNGRMAVLKSQDLNQWVKEGGVTDGGGNLVNGQLYDYWIKSGTQVVPLDQLLQWNPELIAMLDYIKEYSPKAPNLRYTSWYDQIINAASKQEWILDSKPIVNVNCWNLSPNVSNYQEVAACNTTHLVRIDGKKFLVELVYDGLAQAGLIMHELLLSWAKDTFGVYMSKLDLEEAVREINVAVKNQHALQAVLRKFIPKSQILTKQEIAQLFEIQSNLFFTGTSVCKKGAILNAGYFKAASLSPVVRTYLGSDIDQLVTLLNSIGTDKESIARIKFCYDLHIYHSSGEIKTSINCRKNIDNSIDEIFTSQLAVDYGGFPKFKANLSMKLATECYDSERFKSNEEREEIFIQALDYFEKSLNRYYYFFNPSPFNLGIPRG